MSILKKKKTLFECFFFGGQVFYAKKKHVFFEEKKHKCFRIASLVVPDEAGKVDHDSASLSYFIKTRFTSFLLKPKHKQIVHQSITSFDNFRCLIVIIRSTFWSDFERKGCLNAE